MRGRGAAQWLFTLVLSLLIQGGQRQFVGVQATDRGIACREKREIFNMNHIGTIITGFLQF